MSINFPDDVPLVGLDDIDETTWLVVSHGTGPAKLPGAALQAVATEIVQAASVIADQAETSADRAETAAAMIGAQPTDNGSIRFTNALGFVLVEVPAAGIAPDPLPDLLGAMPTEDGSFRVANALGFVLVDSNEAPGPSMPAALAPVATDGRTLRRWRAARARYAVAPTEKVRLLCLGDSWMDITRLPQAIADVLAPTLPSAHGGWIPLDEVDAVPGGPLWGGSIARSGSWTVYDAGIDSGQPALPTAGCGIDGKCLYTTGADATLTITAPASELRIYHHKGTGSWRYRVDGGAWTTVAGGGGGLGIVKIVGLAAGSHTLDIATTGNTGLVGIYGVYAVGTGGGLDLLKCGNGRLDGSQLAIYASTMIAPIAADIAPDLAIIVLGTNDALHGQSSPAIAQAALRSTIQALRAGASGIGVILVVPAAGDYTPLSAPLAAYRDAYFALAAEMECEALSLVDEWDLYPVEAPRGQWADPYHPSDAGSCRIASSLARRFLSL